MPVNKKTNKNILRDICIVGTAKPIRGISPYCESLAHALAELANIRLISFKSIYPDFLYPGGRSKDNEHKSDERSYEVKNILAWYNPISWIKPGLLRGTNIVHIQWWSLPLAPVMITVALTSRLTGKTVITTLHNTQSHDKNSFYYRFFTTIIMMSSHGVIVHSKSSLNNLNDWNRQYLKRKPTKVIPHGLLKPNAIINNDNKSPKEKLGLPDNKKIILIFGALRQYKGIEESITAFSQTLQKKADCHLVIAGKTWKESDHIIRLIKKYRIEDSVTLHDRFIPENEVSYYMQAADLILLPYREFTGHSGVAATAMSFGLPAIVSNKGGLPDLVVDKKQIVPALNSKKLEEILTLILQDTNFLNNLRERTIEHSKNFEWAKIAQSTLGFYKMVRKKTS